MSLWANTADGWGSDPSSSGNGALASYLQSSNASAPQSNSSSQVSDPSTSTPTSSVARTVQPSVSKLAYGVTGGLAAQPTALTQYQPTTLATALVPSTSLAAVPAVSKVATSTAAAPTLSYDTPTATPAATTASTPSVTANIATAPTLTAPASTTTAPTYSGPQVTVGLTYGDSGFVVHFSKLNPTSGQYQDAGSYDQHLGTFTTTTGQVLSGAQASAAEQALTSQSANNLNNGQAMNAALSAGANISSVSNTNNAAALTAYNNALTANSATNAANLAASKQSQMTQYYLEQLTANGVLPTQAQAHVATNSLDGGAADNAARAAATQQYQANQASAAAITQGVATVDTSTQDAANQASLAAISSRYSTNLMGTNIGAMGRLYAAAIPTQVGTNKQLSDEDYAARFDQNLTQFSSAVNNQATLDANATGVKLQSDITAIGDAVTKLNQQVTQLGTTAGQAVSGSLIGLQYQINQYQLAVQHLGANNSITLQLAKGIIGTAAAAGALAV